MLKVTVVTPYYKEESAVLWQCHNSVLCQSYECHHILVSDGHPHSGFENSPRTLHVKLPLENSDNGNTPRAIGGILAESYGFDAIAFLDADNWLDPTHIEQMIAAHERTGSPIVACKRRFYDLSGSEISVSDPDEDANLHVDTSCYMLFRPAFSLLRSWLMPKELGSLCDRVFLKKAISAGFKLHYIAARTVAFRTQYLSHYQRAGISPSPNLKGADTHDRALNYLISGKAGSAEYAKLFRDVLPIPKRNEPCPCGSGKRYKHCHGAR
jgi:glycosyltransferase involved in cell wall biosynthesis